MHKTIIKGWVKMLRENVKMRLSQYRNLYDIIVPKDNLLRKIKENIDFSFVNPMLKEQYCEKFGRPAAEPEMMRVNQLCMQIKKNLKVEILFTAISLVKRNVKTAHGLKKADSMGLAAMRLQMFFTAFAVNVKRIVKLIEISAA